MRCIVCGKQEAFPYAAGYLCDRDESDCYWLRSGHTWFTKDGPILTVNITHLIVKWDSEDTRYGTDVVTFQAQDNWRRVQMPLHEFRLTYTPQRPTTWDYIARGTA